MTANKAYPPHLRRMVDFCCDRVAGCGHHVDGHGYGNDCQVPGCTCQGWRDHTVCEHRRMDATDPSVEVERLRAYLAAHREFAARVDVYAVHDELTQANVEALHERLTEACDLATGLHGDGQ